MTIDKQKLKSLAEVARDFKDSGVAPGTFSPYESEFHGAADPDSVLALLAEIDSEQCWSRFMVQVSNQWHDRYHVCLAQLREALVERDKLKAENEALYYALRRVEKCTDGAFTLEGKWQICANVMDLVRRTLWPTPAPGAAVAEWQVPGSEANAPIAKEAK